MNNLTTINVSRESPNPEEVVGLLKREMILKDVYQKIWYQQIIQRTAQERNINVTPEEIQEEADRQRLEKRLEKASDTLAWLTEQMIDPDDWETGIYNRLLRKKLSEHLFDKEAEKYFAEHKLDYEQLTLYQIIVPYQQVAQELFYQIEEQEISFYEAAHLYDIDERRRYCCGYEGKMYRWSLKPDVAITVFSAPIGEIVGPIQTEQGYHLLMIQEFIQPKFTPEIRKEIIHRLFKDWLETEFNYWRHNC